MQELNIHLKSRDNIVETFLYTRIYTQDDLALGTSDRDVVILIPGGPGNDCTMYDTPQNSIAKIFSTVVDVILFDPRGCGKNAPSPIEHCSLENYIDDIEAIRQYFKIPPEKFIVFGQSYGSIAALGYAIKYADNLKKLLLISAIASSEFIEQAKQDLESRGSIEQKKMAERIWHGSFKNKNDLVKFCQIMGPLYSYSHSGQDDTELEIPCTINILNYGWGNFLKHFNFKPEIHKVNCPVLILWGENEWLMGRKQAYEVHQLIPSSRLVTYQKCGHMLWLDQWERFVDDSLAFFVEQYE